MDEATRAELAEAIGYATLAPSTNNTQPWKFEIAEGTIRVLPDFGRCLPVADPLNRELYISLGCAL